MAAKRLLGPLSGAVVVVVGRLYAVTAVAIGAGVTWWAWPPTFPTPDEAKDRISAVAEQTKAETDAIRTGLAAAGGAGAVFTLLLAVRRQRTTEDDSQQQRMTELYTVAAEQLGHDSAAVRLAGLYALQRLGLSYPEQRQAIVNVWCAYLRMPFRDPDADGVEGEERAERRQELQVRLTVQRLLREHVHSGPPEGEPASPQYWGDKLDVDLTGATLYELDLRACRIHPRTTFAGATFAGGAWFESATFTGDATSGSVTFAGGAWFGDASFANGAWFKDATFTGSARFGGVSFAGDAEFDYATFTGDAWFEKVTFTSHARFGDVSFAGDVRFDGAMARRDRDHVWPTGWELVGVASGEAPEGEDPDAPWGQVVSLARAENGMDAIPATADGADVAHP